MARLPAPFDPASVPTNASLAEALSAAGLRVFPCAPYDGYAAGKAAKAPLVLWRSSATAQRASVQRWWQQWPDAMPGIDLGASGFLVVDADGAAGIAAFEAICEPHGGVPECPMVDTPSGGRHYWFKLPKGLALGNGRGALPPKASCAIDIRGVGGFVIAPGALRDDGLYSIPDGDPLDVLHSPELPDFLRQVLTSTREEIGPGPSSQNPLAPVKAPEGITLPPVRIDMENPRLRAWVESAFQQEIQALAQAGKGGRNEQLNRSAFAVYQLVAAGWIKDEHAHAALLDAAATCGLLRDDGRKQVLATLASGKRGGLAQPRQAPEEFARDDEDAALGAEIARRLVKSRDGTLHDAETGEVLEPVQDDSDEVPERLMHVPGLVGEIMDWILASAQRPSRPLALGAALVLVGTAMGRYMAGPTKSSTVLYVLGLAPTGAGKDHPLQSIKRILIDSGMEKLLGADEFASGPAVVSMVKRAPLAVCPMDEFGAFLKRVNNRKSDSWASQISKHLRQLWTIKYGVWGTQEQAQSSGVNISAPHISVFGVSVHEETFSALEGGDVLNGFLNRFLFLPVNHRPAPADPTVSEFHVPTEITSKLRRIFGGGNEMTQGLVTQSMTDAKDPRSIPWADTNAKALYDAFKGEIERRGDTDKTLAPFLARTVEMSIRLATIRAQGVNTLKPSVSVADMEWGRDLALWSAVAMARACGLYIAETQAQADANRILRIIKEMGGKATKAAVTRKLRNVMRAREMDDTWKMLLLSGSLIKIGEEKGLNGRMVEWFKLD